MKKLKLMLLVSVIGLAGISSVSASTWRSFERVSRADSFVVTVDIQEGKVRCSALGYGMEELKIEVPELKFNAVFDHANFGEAQPCMTAGACKNPWIDFGLTPEDLIQGNPGIEPMTVERVLIETFDLHLERQTCQRRLQEKLRGVLRGLEFNHSVTKSIGDLPFESCLDIENTLN